MNKQTDLFCQPAQEPPQNEWPFWRSWGNKKICPKCGEVGSLRRTTIISKVHRVILVCEKCGCSGMCRRIEFNGEGE